MSNFADSVVGYSVKTNSLPRCMKIAADEGAFAEVVSADEYDLARVCGFAIDHMIYNGPMKSKDTFLDAVTGNAIVNIESKRELLWLKELPADGNFRVGLRLNINISHVSPDDADGEDDNSRFGFSDATTEFSEAIEFIRRLGNVTLSGLHIHRTAHSRSIRFYEHSVDYACRVIEKYHLALDYIDVGGGYFGIFPNKPTYQEYCDGFYRILQSHNLERLRVIVEPGNALVASCFSFLTEVIDTKKVDEGLWFATTDGSRNDVDPFFRKTSYMSEILYRGDGRTIVPLQIVAGCTCLESDRLFACENKPLMEVGDRILYHNVGAYTMCLSPLFIRYLPNIYQMDGDSFELVREKWTVNEYIQKSLF